MKLPPSLTQPFRLLIFGWEGTAVAEQPDEAGAVWGPVERLLRSGVLVMAIAETGIAELQARLPPGIGRAPWRNLYLATHGGSEIHGFDAHARPVMLWRHTATARQQQLLQEVVEAVRLDIGARLSVHLAPASHARWSFAPAVAACAHDGEARLAEGLRDIAVLARRIAAGRGLKVRITGDTAHVMIGLADRGAAVAWMLRDLAGPRGIAPTEILIGGHAFGSMGDIPGADAPLLLPEIKAATIVSVGPEPDGAPASVLHLGGGPSRFRELLAAQAALRPVPLPGAPTEATDWIFAEEEPTLTREHELESLFAIGNGYVGSRGSLAEGNPLSAPATFVAGVFDTGPEFTAGPGDRAGLDASVGDGGGPSAPPGYRQGAGASPRP